MSLGYTKAPIGTQTAAPSVRRHALNTRPANAAHRSPLPFRGFLSATFAATLRHCHVHCQFHPVLTRPRPTSVDRRGRQYFYEADVPNRLDP